ncbi:glycosyltransferase [Acholeplasma granularum]|uniref:glycosyltransferase n=1 Tax=Acholeplasma granularum TaxID=264635 RepID=UPI0004701119|nr:glycosyltransferase [Acholeplasma granularum]
MTIVFVIDNYLHQTNGTVITARRFIEKLRKRGHTVRILSCGLPDTDYFPLKERKIPIVSRVAKKQDVIFSKPDTKIILSAIKDADIVHLVTPWKTSRITYKLCKNLGIPVTASFHIQPENITYGIGLSNAYLLNKLIYNKFKKLYGKLDFVHAPSNFIANELKKNNYTTSIKVISNGVSDIFFNQEPNFSDDIFHIVSTGRYAKEKNQITLLKAINKSKYKDKIKLTLPGQGPKEKTLKSYAKKNSLNVEFGFLSQEDLINTLTSASLYVHPAHIEIEAIACIEAIAVGIVPLIANSKKSATPQFALDDKSLFKPNDVDDLVSKIEYWIENKDIRLEYIKKYKNFSNKYRLDYSIDLFEEMLLNGIQANKNRKLSETLKGKAFSRQFNKKPVAKTVSALAYYLIALPLLSIYLRLFLNVKFKNRKHFRNINGGAVIISNHVHLLDGVMNSLASFPKRPIMTAQQDNFKKPVAGFFVNLLGAVPIPETIMETRLFFDQLGRRTKQGRFVHVYPEGELKIQDDEIRTFKNGAFKLAVDSGVPIIPVRIHFTKGKYRKQIVVNVGKAVYPDLMTTNKDAQIKLKNETIEMMSTL